jgi:hypothetical protein
MLGSHGLTVGIAIACIYCAGLAFGVSRGHLVRRVRDAARATSILNKMHPSRHRETWEGEVLARLKEIESTFNPAERSRRSSSRVLASTVLLASASFLLVLWINLQLAVRVDSRPVANAVPEPSVSVGWLYAASAGVVLFFLVATRGLVRSRARNRRQS